MGKVIDIDELLVFITDKVFSDDTLASKSDNIYWLHAKLKDFYQARGESFDFTDTRINALNERLEVLMSIKRSGHDIFENLKAMLNERINTRWEAIDTKLDTFGTEGFLTNTGLIMPLRGEITHLSILSTQIGLINLKLQMLTFNQVDEAIQTLKNDLQDIVQEFDNFFAINN